MVRSTIYSLLTLACMGSGVAAAQEIPDPRLDEVREQGFSLQHAAAFCVGVTPELERFTADTLPVGAEAGWIECQTGSSILRRTQSVEDSQGKQWCALGEVDDASPYANDAALELELMNAGIEEAWSVRATHSGEDTIEVSRLSAYAWPIGINAHYNVLEIQQNMQGVSCDELFQL